VIRDLDEILDVAIEQVRDGESLDEVLARYPQEAVELEPLLELALGLADDAEAALPAELEAWRRARAPVPRAHSSAACAAYAILDTPFCRTSRFGSRRDALLYVLWGLASYYSVRAKLAR
jgi:hypothetical protein